MWRKRKGFEEEIDDDLPGLSRFDPEGRSVAEKGRMYVYTYLT